MLTIDRTRNDEHFAILDNSPSNYAALALAYEAHEVERQQQNPDAARTLCDPAEDTISGHATQPERTDERFDRLHDYPRRISTTLRRLRPLRRPSI